LSGGGGRAAFQRAGSHTDDFVGRGRTEAETFVGRAQGEATTAIGDTSAALRRIRAQDILSRRRLNANVLQIQRGTSARGPIYTPRLEVEFVHPSAATIAGDRQSERTVAKIFAAHGLSRATIGVETGIATLRGKVSTKAEKRLAAAVVLLEPGIWKVDNQLQLPSESVTDAEPLNPPQ